MIARAVAALLFVLVAGAWAVRSAAVHAFAEDRPQLTANFWPNHPEVLRALGMIGVGEAAGRREEPSAETMRSIGSLARTAPLEPEPMLVAGALAQQRGDLGRAERLLEAARARDPRSPAARFLLADLYLRSGRVAEGVTEMSVLTSLVPNSSFQMTPALKQFATSGGDLDQLQQLLSRNPGLARSLLTELARDPDNAELVVALAAGGAGDAAGEWRTKIVEALLQHGQYERARNVWSRLAGRSAPPSGLFNPGFTDTSTPPPFNWSLASRGGGLAEPSNGGLRVLYYGRDDAQLAAQTLLLPAGRYSLEAGVTGKVPSGGSVQWTITCLDSDEALLRLPLTQSGAVSADFAVPASCKAQRILLVGKAGDVPESADFQISGLQLRRSSGG